MCSNALFEFFQGFLIISILSKSGCLPIGSLAKSGHLPSPDEWLNLGATPSTRSISPPPIVISEWSLRYIACHFFIHYCPLPQKIPNYSALVLGCYVNHVWMAQVGVSIILTIIIQIIGNMQCCFTI